MVRAPRMVRQQQMVALERTAQGSQLPPIPWKCTLLEASHQLV